MGTHFDYERRAFYRKPVATKGGQGMAAADWKQASVLACVRVKGVEGWRMPAWSTVDWSEAIAIPWVQEPNPLGSWTGGR